MLLQCLVHMFHYVSMFKQGTAARKDAAPFAHRPMQILIFSAPRLLSVWNSFQIFSRVPYVFHHFWNFSPEAQRSFPALKQNWLHGHSQGLWLAFPWGIVAKDLGRSAKVRQGTPRNAKLCQEPRCKKMRFTPHPIATQHQARVCKYIARIQRSGRSVSGWCKWKWESMQKCFFTGGFRFSRGMHVLLWNI